MPVGTLGALKLQQEESPLASSAITYAYDALGRLSSRTVAGAGAEGFGYDAIGRLNSHTNDLGSFTLSYLGQTGQIAGRTLAGSTLATAWSYLPNSGDRRLAGIDNTGLTSGQYSNFTYTSMPESLISALAESSDAATVYPATGSQSLNYNILNQLSGAPYSYDQDGNLLTDATRTYTWDAENRLAGITLTGRTIAFAYDGLGRRTAITVNGVTTSYLWCGSRICQARNSSNATTREYYAEGEFLPGTPAHPYYYGPDQIGTPRRVFASTTSAPAYAYDPYGVPLQATVPVTDFNYAGMFYQPDSGLYLTQYRAYDPTTGQWLSRDPIGEMNDPAWNLYRYADGNPISIIDPTGRQGVVGAIIGAVAGAAYGATSAIAAGGGFGAVVVGAAAGFGSGALIGAVNAGIPVTAAAGLAIGAATDVTVQEATSVVESGSLAPVNPGEVAGAALLAGGGAALAGVAVTAGASPAAAALLSAYVGAPLALLPNVGGAISNVLGQSTSTFFLPCVPHYTF